MATLTNEKKFMMVWTSQGNKTLRFAPGLCEIEDEDLIFLLKHPVFKDYIKRGWITSVKDITSYVEVKDVKKNKPAQLEDKSKKEEPAEDLENLSLRELIKAITELTDKEQLEKYAKDSRKRVADAAQDQLKLLDTEIKKND